VLQSNLDLQSGECREVLIMLGIGDAEKVGQPTVKAYGSLEQAGQEFADLKQSWHSRLGVLNSKTPDAQFDSMMNVWAPYNAMVTFAWSRSASLVYNGERDGLGYRDSVQDVLGIASTMPKEARQRLELLLTGQTFYGGAMPLIKPFTHRPGYENPPPDEEYRSDDCLWLFNSIPAYVTETGDVDFYNLVLPFADHGQATVFGHLRRALEFNLKHIGRNGLPCGLSADWNDCLKLGYHGESLFVSFQVYFGLGVYAELADLLGQPAEAAWARINRKKIGESIQKICWDGEWFIWAIGEDGTVYGTRDCQEGQVYLNTQVWAVISGAATREQAEKCMETVNQRLATPYGLMLLAPPFDRTPFDVMRAVLFLDGVKENAGIFNHTQSWAVMAECILGNGDRAFEYYRAFMPAAYNDRGEIRQSEPYAQAQTTYSTASPRAGNARTSWLSGAAPWAYYSATQYILGIRPELNGLRLDPCIPSTWPGFRAIRQFRGQKIEIEVKNPRGVCKGVQSVMLNGQPLADNLLPAGMLQEKNQVVVVMG